MVNKGQKMFHLFYAFDFFYLKSTLTIEESFVASKLLLNQIEMIDSVLKKDVTTQLCRNIFLKVHSINHFCTGTTRYIKQQHSFLILPSHLVSNYTFIGQRSNKLLLLFVAENRVRSMYLFTPPRSPRISRLKSQIMNPTFLS